MRNILKKLANRLSFETICKMLLSQNFREKMVIPIIRAVSIFRRFTHVGLPEAIILG